MLQLPASCNPHLLHFCLSEELGVSNWVAIIGNHDEIGEITRLELTQIVLTSGCVCSRFRVQVYSLLHGQTLARPEK